MHISFRFCALALACALALTACGGGGGGSSASSGSQTPPSSASNVQSIIVDSGPDPTNSASLNEVFTSVTICAPANPTLCQTIDHILVDTGSEGLRVVSSVLSPQMATALSAQSTGNSTMAECTIFVDGYTWGPVRSVNFQIAGESANNMPMQVIGDPNFSLLVPSACSKSGKAENTVDAFGSNGVLGVGAFQQDCGSYCVTNAGSGTYYACSSTSCTGSAAGLAQQVPNPVSLFASDNNGVVISLPTIAAGTAATSITGTLTFGVGTRSNNALGSATIFQMDSIGNFTTVFNGATLDQSFFDSGSNGLYFPNSINIATCSDGFYCPASLLNLSATLEVVKNSMIQVSQPINFTIGNVDAATNNTNYAVYASMGAPNPGSAFDWGLPFFFGRNVFVVTENQTINGQTGPLFAF